MAQDHILTTDGLTKEFSGFLAVKDVSLRIRRGTIHAIIGPNGAGKTTCFNLLSKFLEPTRGRIVYNGRDMTGARPADVAQAGIARSFQISAVFPNVSALQNVRLALQRLSGATYRFWRSDRILDALNDRAEELLTAVGLSGLGEVPAAELPYGSKRALELATTLALDPQLLLLDEPTAGMGHQDVDRICGLIRAAARDRTVLMVEHNLGVVATLCDAITVLHRGEVLAEGDYEAVSCHPGVVEAYLGTGYV